MIYFMIISFLAQIVFSIAGIRLLEMIHKAIQEEQPKVITRTPRKHPTVKTSNYDNSYNNRGYEQFKDKKTGLYEPQKPHKGIELKKQKED